MKNLKQLDTEMELAWQSGDSARIEAAIAALEAETNSRTTRREDAL